MRERVVLLTTMRSDVDLAEIQAFRQDALSAASHPSVRADVRTAGEDTLTSSDTSLSACFRTGFEAGYSSVLVLDHRAPHLPIPFLTDAFGRIERQGQADIVFGPEDTGGWYLAAAPQTAWERVHPLLSNFPAEAEVRLSKIEELARSLGLRVELLPPWYTIHTTIHTSWDRSRLTRDLTRGVAQASATLSHLHHCIGNKPT